MSIRKVSELPYIDVRDKSIQDNLNLSRLEISYSNHSDETRSYWFTSKQVKYGEMVEQIANQVAPIVGQEIAAGLSGNLLLNDVDDVSSIGDYRAVLKSGINILYATKYNIIQADGEVGNNVLTSRITEVFTDDMIVHAYDDTERRDSIIEVHSQGGAIQMKRDTYIYANMDVQGSINCHNIVYAQEFRNSGADLAEKYLADAPYGPGTFVRFGGDKEVTVADGEANAVVASNPGIVMGDLSGDNVVNLALAGRVPVKVKGAVRKFDRLVMSDVPGVARAARDGDETPAVGRALSGLQQDENDIGLVEAVVQLRI